MHERTVSSNYTRRNAAPRKEVVYLRPYFVKKSCFLKKGTGMPPVIISYFLINYTTSKEWPKKVLPAFTASRNEKPVVIQPNLEMIFDE